MFKTIWVATIKRSLFQVHLDTFKSFKPENYKIKQNSFISMTVGMTSIERTFFQVDFDTF